MSDSLSCVPVQKSIKPIMSIWPEEENISFIGLPSVPQRSKLKMPWQIVVMMAPMMSGTNIVPAGTFCSVFQMLTFLRASIAFASFFSFLYLLF